MPKLPKDLARSVAKAKRVTTTASDVKPRRVRWLWKGRIPYGYLSLWSGASGLGKSTFFCWLVAEITHGRLEAHAEPSDVLIIASEDAREDTWVPRLIAAEADLSRVHFFDRPDVWDIRDGIGLVEQALTEHSASGPEGEPGATRVGLVFLDSVFEETPEAKGKESINASDFIRQVFKPLNRLCREHGVAGLISTHPPKAGGQTYAANVHASGAFVQLARIGLMLGFHPEDINLPTNDEKRRVLLRPGEGSNIGRDPGAVEFKIRGKFIEIDGESEEVPHVQDVSPSTVTFRDMVADPKKERPTTKVAQVRLHVEALLKDGEWHRSVADELVTNLETSKSTVSAATAGVVVMRKAPDNTSWWHKPGPGASKQSFDTFWRGREGQAG